MLLLAFLMCGMNGPRPTGGIHRPPDLGDAQTQRLKERTRFARTRTAPSRKEKLEKAAAAVEKAATIPRQYIRRPR